MLWSTAGEIEHVAGHLELALEHFEKAIEYGGSPDAALRAAMIRWQLGQRDEAARTLDPIAASARREIERGSEWSQEPLKLAAVEAIRGNVDEAVAWYERAVDAGHRAFYADEGDPIFSAVRDDPRFVAQLKRMRSEVASMKQRLVHELGPGPERILRHFRPPP